MKLTAHDVRELSEAIREIAAWNAANPMQMVIDFHGPYPTEPHWLGSIRSVDGSYDTGRYYASHFTDANTLGDAVKAAMKAWKEGRE